MKSAGLICGLFIASLFLFLLNCDLKNDAIQYTDSKNNKVELFTVEKGKGRPIVFIHGNSFDHSIWRKQFESKLSEKYRLIAYDLRGHGRSIKYKNKDKVSSQYSVKLHAEDLEQILKYYNLSEPIVVGWSLGGNIILHYLANNKNSKIGKAVIFGATPSFGLSGDKNYPGSAPSEKMKYILNEFLLKKNASDEAIIKFVKEALSKNSDDDELSVSEIKRWAEVVSNTDGFARLGITDGLPQISKDLADRKLDMSDEEFFSYNIIQVELLDKIAAIKTPVKIILSENDMFSVDQIQYSQKLNPKMFSASKPYKAGHAVFYNSPDIFYEELTRFIEN
ncbi:MAG: alpha/beta hydrolase [Spirochaetia bacterium]|nr:alpha/beta hydrolase [Spirochaetia bacterium]